MVIHIKRTMKTLKDKEFYKCGRKKCDRCLPCIYSEDIKQAIKDLKDKLFIKTKKGKIVIPACKIIPTIDKVMGVWEE